MNCVIYVATAADPSETRSTYLSNDYQEMKAQLKIATEDWVIEPCLLRIVDEDSEKDLEYLIVAPQHLTSIEKENYNSLLYRWRKNLILR